MNIAIIDDDKNFLKIFSNKVKSLSRNVFDTSSIDSYTNCETLLEKKYDIYFLDVDLIKLNGIDIAKFIKEDNPAAKIIFVTSRSDLIFSAITVQPFYFIRKTNLEKDLTIAFTLLTDYYTVKEYYKIKYDSEIISILIDDIIYLETSDHLTTIYTDNKQYHVYKTLKTVQNEINSRQIIQINRKNCVNVLHIVDEQKNYIKLDNDIILKIGKPFKNEFLSTLKEYAIEED